MPGTDHYCTADDVNKLVPQALFSATSRPTIEDLQALIEDIANDMDAMLANVGYTVPVVSGPKALQWLRVTCKYGVLGIAQDIRDTGVRTAVSASGKEVENIWSQRHRARMKALCDPQDPTELADAPANSEQIEKSPDQVLRSFVQGVTDDADFDPDAPVVTRQQVL